MPKLNTGMKRYMNINHIKEINTMKADLAKISDGVKRGVTSNNQILKTSKLVANYRRSLGSVCKLAKLQILNVSRTSSN